MESGGRPHLVHVVPGGRERVAARLRHSYREPESRSTRGHALDADRSTHQLHELLRDGEAEAAAALAGSRLPLHLREGFENRFVGIRGDADTGVVNRETQLER